MPAARQPERAGFPLVDALNAIADCVIDRRFVAKPAGVPPDVFYSIGFGGADEPAPLRAKAGGPSGVMLDAKHSFVLTENETSEAGPTWRTVSSAYEIRILDRQEQELLVFHWQPGAAFRGPDFPHLHVSAVLSAQVSATRSERLPLDKWHVPTGMISLADVVRMLVAEFGIAARYRDWPARLARAETAIRRTYP